MAKRRRRSSKRANAPADEKNVRWTHGRIWLATLSTVVGIATGMFTLRDQVFPREAGSAQAGGGQVMSLEAYQEQVGRSCDELNSNDRRRARQTKTIDKQLRRARTTIAQRNALLDGQRQEIARSGHALARFTALETPKGLVATRRATEAAWNRNLDRLRAYALRLDRVGTRNDLFAATRYLASLRAPLAKDGVKLMAGLERLGKASCDLNPPIATKTAPLPPLRTHKRSRSHTAQAGSGASGGTSGNGSGGTGPSVSTGGTVVGHENTGGGTGPSVGTGGTTGGGITGRGGSTHTGGTTGGSGGPARGGGGSTHTGGTTGGGGTSSNG